MNPRKPSVRARMLMSAAMCVAGFAASQAAATTVPASDVTYNGRTLDVVLADTVNVKDYGAVGNGSTSDCTAFSSALATGKSVRVPSGHYMLPCQLTMNANGQELMADAGILDAQLDFTGYGGSGPLITVGNGSTQTFNMAVRNFYIDAPQGVYAFQTEWTRGFRLFHVQGHVDGFITLGDSALGTGKPSYVFEMYDGVEINQQHSPTLDLIKADNFLGEYTADHASLAATCASDPCRVDVNGFNAQGNIQDHIDHFTVTGGYMGHFNVNYNFEDTSLLGGKFTNHIAEYAKDHSYVFEVPGNSTRNSAQSTYYGIDIIGGDCDAINECVYIKNASPVAAPFQGFNIANLQVTGSSGVKTPVYIEQSGATSLVKSIIVDGLTGWITPTDANQDGVRIVGTSNPNLKGVTVRNVALEAKTTALRAGVYMDPASSGASQINIGAINAINATAQLSATALSATSDPLNAANIVTGTLPAARLPTAAITGGTINGATVGQTTPAAVGATQFVRTDPSTTPTARTDVNGNTPGLQSQGTTSSAGIGGFYYNANSAGFITACQKSRGATLGAQTIVQSGDVLCDYVFGGSDGTNFVPAARLRVEVDGTPGASDMPGRWLFQVSKDGTATPATVMALFNNGHLGFLTQTGLAPTVASGAGDCGTSPAIAGDDNAGRVTVGTGANGSQCTITFGSTWATNAPVCSIASEGNTTAMRISSVSQTALVVAGPFAAGDKFNFRCVGYQ